MQAALVVCRCLHYAAAMLLFGVSVFQATLAPAGLARALDRPLRRVAAPAVVVAALTAAAWLALAAGAMGEGWRDAADPAAWAFVLTGTGFGRVWQWHLAIAAGLVAVQLVAVQLVAVLAAGRLDCWALTAALGALLLAGLGGIGHAVMPDGALGWVSRASQALHLLAAGFWLGCLIPLLACLRPGWCLRLGLGTAAALALRRFSSLGHAAVATVVATGLLNIRLVLGRWPVELASPYQALLLAKLGLVAALVGLALVNRYVLVPRLPDDLALRRLRHSTIAEVLLGVGVLALVSAIGTLAPD